MISLRIEPQLFKKDEDLEKEIGKKKENSGTSFENEGRETDSPSPSLYTTLSLCRLTAISLI